MPYAPKIKVAPVEAARTPAAGGRSATGASSAAVTSSDGSRFADVSVARPAGAAAPSDQMLSTQWLQKNVGKTVSKGEKSSYDKVYAATKAFEESEGDDKGKALIRARNAADAWTWEGGVALRESTAPMCAFRDAAGAEAYKLLGPKKLTAEDLSFWIERWERLWFVESNNVSNDRHDEYRTEAWAFKNKQECEQFMGGVRGLKADQSTWVDLLALVKSAGVASLLRQVRPCLATEVSDVASGRKSRDELPMGWDTEAEFTQSRDREEGLTKIEQLVVEMADKGQTALIKNSGKGLRDFTFGLTRDRNVRGEWTKRPGTGHSAGKHINLSRL